jgi:hypothetical protein
MNIPSNDNPTEKAGASTRVDLSVQACVIRDGTQGISLSIGEHVIGQWTDSRAASVLLTQDLQVAVCSPTGDQLYLFSVPGEPLSGRQISATQVLITFSID